MWQRWADKMKWGEMDRSCTLGGCQHIDLHVDASFGHLLLCQGHSTIWSGAAWLLKNHPIWLILHRLYLWKRKDLQNQLGKVPPVRFPGVCTLPRFDTSRFPLRFQPTPGYKEDATTQRFFSAGLTEESVSFGSLQVSQWDEWPFGRGKTLRVPGDEN